MSIPHLFRCPISLDLFTDPVILSTGQTYDRPSIEKWLADGHLTCPVTMQRLADTTLTPNHTLRHLIDQWLLAGCAAPDSPLPSSATDFSFLALRQTLHSSSAWKTEMLESVKAMCAESDVGRAYLINLGFFPLLLRLLFQSDGAAVYAPAFAGVALDCVLGLAVSCPLEPLNMLKEDANLASFVLFFDHGNLKIKAGLCHLLEMISSCPATQELALLVGSSQRILQILVSLLRGNSCFEASEAAVRATAGLCAQERNRCHAIREAVVDGLVSNLSNCSVRRNASPALAALEQLMEADAGRRALVEHPEGVEVLVRMVFRVSAANNCEESERALGTLLSVCRESEKARSAAVEAGVILQVLLLLQSQGSGKAKCRGRGLLKLLRTSWGGDVSVE